MEYILIIGPGSTFGKELIAYSLEQGYGVVVISKHAESYTKGHSHDQLIGYSYDITDISYSKNLLQVLQNHVIKSVIYNAVSKPKGGLFLPVEDLFASYDCNIKGLFITIQTAAKLPHTKDIPFIVTGGGYKDTPHPNKVALSTSKAAMHTLIQAIHEEALNYNILLKTLVIDGAVGSDISRKKIATAFFELIESSAMAITIRAGGITTQESL